MKDQLCQVINGVPYSSFTGILDVSKESYDQKLGGSCIKQTRKLIRDLTEEGYQAHFIQADSDVLHYATLCREKGQFYYLDPFLMHHEPIAVSKAFRERSQKVYDAYPIVDGVPSKIVVKPKSHTDFNVALWGTAGENGHVHLRDYYYNISNTTPTLPEQVDQRLAKSKQKYLQLRVLGEKGKVMKANLYPETSRMSVDRIGRGKPYMQVTSPEEFFNEMRQISEQIRMSVGDIMETFYKANRIYRKWHKIQGK
jgi:hypothetical protein